MSLPLKWGFLGTSFISNVMADAILEEGSMQLHSVAGRSLDTLATFADTYQIKHRFTDFEALIADPQVDVIYIALPNHLHHQYAIAAANAGKAILCEKSLSIDMAKTDEMIAAARANKVFLMEGLMYLTHPLVAKIIEIIQSGQIGEVKTIRGQYCAAISQLTNPAGKGVLYNLGCYPLSLIHLLIQQLFGDEIFDDLSIVAKGRKDSHGNICESTAIFEFSNQLQCHIHTAEDYGLYAGFTVLGTKGSLEMVSNPWLAEATGNQIRLTEYERPSQLIEVSAEHNAYVSQVKLVKECIENGLPEAPRSAPRLADSRAIMQLLTDWQNACD
jgi:predicted dehydrogenase